MTRTYPPKYGSKEKNNMVSMVKSTKKTPDRKIAQGLTVGTIVAAITAIFTTIFHKSMPVEVATALPAILGLLGHFFGSYLAPYEPRIEEIIAYVKKLVNEIPSA